jgi:DNA-binding GntR family transcriptional regulator
VAIIAPHCAVSLDFAGEKVYFSRMSRASHRTRIHEDPAPAPLRGEVGPDVRLVDHAIAVEMGVSRMPVREALMQLGREGYLESTSRGFALPNLSAERIAEVFVLAAAAGAPCGGLRGAGPD